jgi:hypothetical protein
MQLVFYGYAVEVDAVHGGSQCSLEPVARDYLSLCARAFPVLRVWSLYNVQW